MKKPLLSNTQGLIKETTIKYVTASVLGIVTFLLQILEVARSQYILSKMPALPNKLLFLIILLLLVLFLLSTLLAINFYKKTYVKPPEGGYIFQMDPGFYIHKKTGGHYCNPCLSKGYASQLSIHFHDGYICRTCGEVYIPPNSEDAAWKYIREKQREEDQQ